MLTVTRNDLRGLRRTLESVQRQCYPDVEHIVVDGASTDGSVEELAGYQPPYRSVRISEPDNGIFDAINKALRLVTGRLIVCMNAGDTFSDPGDLQFVAEDWQSDDWQWGFGCMRYVDDEGVPFAGDVQSPFNRRKLELGLSFVPHQAMYVERDFQLELGPYDPSFGIAADQEMAVRAAQRAEPRVWVRFLTDFLAGGSHAQAGRWEREFIYHRIRLRHRRPVLRSSAADAAFSAGISLSRSGRDLLAHLANPTGRRRL